MLSRLATQSVAASWGRPLASRALSTSASKNSDNPWDGPERDLKNFPRRKRAVEPAPCRHHWIPEGYFKMFYPKTGVTGPYAFAATTLTYLLSKEIWVIEHEFVAGLGQLIFLIGVVKMAGPSYVAEIDKEIDAQEDALRRIRQDEIEKCKAAIGAEELAQYNATSYEELIQAKKDAVGLQLEANYRQRLNEAYTQVKKRLDYQLELTNVLRRNEQKHMVDWIISNVRKSITAQQETDALKKCVTDLKAMAK